VVTSISVLPEDEAINDGRNPVRGVFNWVQVREFDTAYSTIDIVVDQSY
jgi:hypothetical protein